MHDTIPFVPSSRIEWTINSMEGIIDATPELFGSGTKIAIETAVMATDAGKVAYSPVSVGKVLHLLCPGFFPLWDDNIAKAYGCKWTSTEHSFDSYWHFMLISLKQVFDLSNQGDAPLTLRNLTVLKLVDEYNYVCFTEKKCP